MGRSYLKLNLEQKHLSKIILISGIALTCLLGIPAFQNTALQNGNELVRNEAGTGSYQQPVIAHINKEKIPLEVTVEERGLSKEEAQKELSAAKDELDELLKGENESLEKVTTALTFVDEIPGSVVEVEWVLKPSEYFYSDGRLREEVKILEPVELKAAAVLSCQEYTEDYETVITLVPKVLNVESGLLEEIRSHNENHFPGEAMILPDQYEGQPVTWKKPLDYSFLYIFFLTVGALIFLKFGAKRDEQQKKQERMEELEREYAQIVSKFTMLLSAGLSIRNAWERILLMSRDQSTAQSAILQEMNWGYREFQKGVSEIEVYEKFGMKVGQVHYKKLMSLFISEKRRGSVNLLEAMNQEMLLAWEDQRRKTKQQGEKIGTKLLLPMMGMLTVVFIIILVPAFLSFQL